MQNQNLGIAPDEMRVTALGTGRPYSSLAQANSSWLVQLGNGDSFLFDYGYGSFTRFAALEVHPGALTATFASHLHTDHVGDFAQFWVTSRIAGRLQPLEVYGPSGSSPELGFAHFAAHQLESYAWDTVSRRGSLPEAGETPTVHEFDWETTGIIYEQRGVVIRAVPAVHVHDGAVSYRLDWNGHSLVYSGDTAPNRFLTDIAAGVDVLVHETANARGANAPVPGPESIVHTNPWELGSVFALTRPRLAVAFHFMNDARTRQLVSDAIRSSYDGPLLLAEDLISVRVGSDISIEVIPVSPFSRPPASGRGGYGAGSAAARPHLSSKLREARLFTGESDA
ncbi:MBL fold metallo-hydrolase [Pseudoclavibacter sp. RFBB5]|uniref:MBL fold metallo-hydrolase n=1 Tax=Pseudoclavibacter sp. RFBB5 TaxID=2080574 RepID=UPI0015E22EAD|nr:MBL fold metallo-hydrolase [Pseudoclavibacter sp. RFBB5]